MKDTYKGESWAKRMVRWYVWYNASSWIEEKRFTSGRHFCLAGRDGGDIHTLRALGVKDVNITAVDCVQSVADSVRGFFRS